MEAVLAKFQGNYALSKANRLLGLLRTRFSTCAEQFDVEETGERNEYAVYYTPTPAEDVQDTIDAVDCMAHFAQGFWHGIEEATVSVT